MARARANIGLQIDRLLNLGHDDHCVAHVVLAHVPDTTSIAPAVFWFCKLKSGSGTGSKSSRSFPVGGLVAGTVQ